MSIGYNTWLSTKEWIGEVIGSPILAVLIGLVLINYLVIKNNIGAKTALILNVLGVFSIVSLAYESSLIAIVGVVLSFVMYGTYAAFWNK